MVAPRTFDLIWCGSVATHIRAELTVALLRKFHDWLTPKGIAVVTTHGRRFAHYAMTREVKYFDGEPDLEPLLMSLAFTGFGYLPHPGQTQGNTATVPSWLMQQVAAMDARVVGFCEHGWYDHQDVVAFQRVA